ncbi:MAG: UDP-N-acetylmuramate dehydrogenase [Candidatus Atribacteria bacterium]|nr:UDP-N-acetylmuramate dehydrogenase [Candidatus Atribacteria bacterium]
MEGWGFALPTTWEELSEEIEKVEGIVVRRNVSLRDLTSWRVGGQVPLMVDVCNLSAFLELIQNLEKGKVCWRVLGAGSNILPRDEGYEGILIRLKGELSQASLGGGGFVEAGAGISLPKLASLALSLGLGGMEFLSGIPGTLGGALKINAGCFGQEIGNLVEQVLIWERNQGLHWVNRVQAGFGYRSSSFKKEGVVLIKALFKAFPDSKEVIKKRMEELQARRAEHQPQGVFCAGSVFKNPVGDYAGRLIESLGFKGLRVGQAQVSNKHANFIINLGGAKADEIRFIIKWIQGEVFRQKGIFLENEVEFWS